MCCLLHFCSVVGRIPSALFELSEKLETEAMAKGIILLGLPVPKVKGKIHIFK